MGQYRTRVIGAILAAFAVLSFGQSTDTWEKSRQCAEQAKKVADDKSRQLLDQEVLDWNNHYSPKYQRCFIEIRHMIKIGTGAPIWGATELQDAFERVRMAYILSAEKGGKQTCNVESEPTECTTARNFIAEHMKN